MKIYEIKVDNSTRFAYFLNGSFVMFKKKTFQNVFEHNRGKNFDEKNFIRNGFVKNYSELFQLEN